MKYIVTETESGHREIFIFPNEVNHDCMAEALYGIRNQTHGDWRRVRRKPVSAGFVTEGKCHGYSETLGLSAHASDTAMLERIVN